MTAQVCLIITIALYLVMMIVVGIIFSKGNEDTGDFYLGGRKLGPFVTAMSAEASDMSSWLLMGIPGLAYISGLADPFWTILGLALGTYLNWLFVAKKVRKQTEILGAITVPEYFSKRFGDKKNILTCISALIIVVFFIPYTASGFAACGKLFNTLFGVNYLLAMVVSAIIIALYCTMGGFKAVCTTDLIQSICMTIALFIVILFGINQAGGLDAVIDNAKDLPGFFSITSVHDATTNSASPYSAITAISMLAWGLGYFGMPHILIRFMAIGDVNKIKTSRRVASVWVVISMAVALLIGIVGLGMSATGVIPTFTNTADSERVIIHIANLMSSYGLFPAIIAGLILAGILAATMSTADSQLLASASAISSDLIQTFFGKKLSDEVSVKVAKITVVLISVVAIFIARDPNSSVFSIVSFAWAGFGAAFGPVVLLALFWKRSTMAGALSGMITGAVVVFLWKYVISGLGGAFAIYELLPAFLLALIVNVIVSLCTKAPTEVVEKLSE
ncbi:sodium/proline symporter [Lachnospira pectinoschiza]|uniref:Sodium/proline symporter n=1 Tax=Lachnospira pectinoschiza TaxID=28052 RepID=A0A1G9TXA2_9FIRM|nr:sodium/proline symporter [Lachnospira pectinoschiza]SDM52312.1 sodium/proline symporter [Lachnospira pectinoschiza]